MTDDLTRPTGPPRRERPPWGPLALFVVGTVMVAGAAVVVLALIMALLFWQLMANVVMVAFVQELRWYGPGVYTSGGDLWWYTGGIAVGGFLVMGLGAWWINAAGATVPRPRVRRRT